MRRLFRAFERSGLDYLLISGQASVLYGAAQFSEDVDLWIRPTAGNASRLLRALASRGARVHKLTPPLTVAHMRRGHGFHFRIPGGADPAYLDVLACPPRVGSFTAAKRRAVTMETPWGRVPVVSIEDLISLKKTRRLNDYEVISNLVEIRIGSEAKPSSRLLRWAADATFRPETRVRLLTALGRKSDLISARKETLRRLERLQAADTSYWRGVISDLRRLRKAGKLWPEGALVSEVRSSAGREEG